MLRLALSERLYLEEVPRVQQQRIHVYGIALGVQDHRKISWPHSRHRGGDNSPRSRKLDDQGSLERGRCNGSITGADHAKHCQSRRLDDLAPKGDIEISGDPGTHEPLARQH